MNFLKKIFKKEASNKPIITNKYTSKYFEGFDAFKVGKKLFSESVLDYSVPKERRLQKIIAALEFLDKAVEKGYDESEVFSIRGLCLRHLDYDIDALKDFDKCIVKEPERASYFYDRAITKQYLYDFEGSLADFNEAIRLSKIENENTRAWDNYAKESGWGSGTQKYEHDLGWLMMDIERFEKYPDVHDDIIKSKKNKRRSS